MLRCSRCCSRSSRASSTDVLANFFKVSLNATLWFFRIAVIVVPIIAGLFT